MKKTKKAPKKAPKRAAAKAKVTAAVPFLNLPLQHQRLKGKLLAAIGRVIEGSHFILGPETQALEKEIAALCGAAYAWGVNSGTDALILALRALNIGPGDEVIMPDFTFVATASSVLLAGATPVLADIEPNTFTLDPEQVAQKITPRTRALIPVHLYGHPANMEKLLALARERQVAVIEDAAQALGAQWQGKPVGSLGDIGCLSFFPTKNLGGLGDGGMVLTNSPEISRRLNRLRQHGAERKYYHDELGLNSRLDEIQSASLRIKLPYLAAWNQRRRDLAAVYHRGLKSLPLALPEVHPQALPVYHQYTVRTRERNRLQAFLTDHHINTAVHYPLALHQQPMLQQLPSARGDFPESQAAAEEVLCLPIAPEITDAQVQRIIRTIRAFWEKGPRGNAE